MAKEKEAATPHRVLVVDDDAEIIDTVQFALKQKGYDVITIRPQAPVMEMLKLLRDHNLGAVVVSDDGTRTSRRGAGRVRRSSSASTIDATYGWIRSNRPPKTTSRGLRTLTRPASPIALLLAILPRMPFGWCG